MFSIINVSLAFITVIVLLAGTLQGIIAYSNYCNDDNDYNYYNFGTKRCEFKHARNKYDADVDFIAVVVLSGVGALFWVSS